MIHKSCAWRAQLAANYDDYDVGVVDLTYDNGVVAATVCVYDRSVRMQSTNARDDLVVTFTVRWEVDRWRARHRRTSRVDELYMLINQSYVIGQRGRHAQSRELADVQTKLAELVDVELGGNWL